MERSIDKAIVSTSESKSGPNKIYPTSKTISNQFSPKFVCNNVKTFSGAMLVSFFCPLKNLPVE